MPSGCAVPYLCASGGTGVLAGLLTFQSCGSTPLITSARRHVVALRVSSLRIEKGTRGGHGSQDKGYDILVGSVIDT